jgi:hypothetical protein
MRRTFIGTLCALGVTALSTSGSAFAQQRPDFSGIWLLTRSAGGGRGDVRLPETEWSTEKLPFTAKGRETFLANKPGKGPRMVAPVNGNDPIGGANPPGLYRALIYARNFEFVQSQMKLVQLFEWGRIFREIYADGRPVPDDIPDGPYWYGYSVGQWEGDTLVVETLALENRAWLDEWGTPISDQARVLERWRKTASDRLELRITVTDPVMYVKPWTSMPIVFGLQKKGELKEIIFAPMDEQEFNNRIRNPAGTAPKP